MAALRENDPEEAIDILTDALKEMKDATERDQALLMLAFAHAQARQWGKARQYLAQYLQKHPEDTRALSLKASLPDENEMKDEKVEAEKDDDKPVLRRRP
jgi:Tfp pilus assembly protein PilF